MNPNTINDLFIFNFPKSFITEELEAEYMVYMKNFRKPFPTVLDYLNSNIKEINLPSFNAPTSMQKRLYGKEQNFRGSKNPYDLTNREFEVIMRNTDSNLTYWILVDIFYSHYIKNGTIYIEDDFTISTLDSQRREMFKTYIKNVLFLGLPNLKMANNDKSPTEKTLSLKFMFNYIDTQKMLSFSDNNSNGELIEAFSDVILPNDDSVPKTPPNISDGDDDTIIGH
jgi:hypothetical protein